jgi:hypothetical protein
VPASADVDVTPLLASYPTAVPDTAAVPADVAVYRYWIVRLSPLTSVDPVTAPAFTKLNPDDTTGFPVRLTPVADAPPVLLSVAVIVTDWPTVTVPGTGDSTSVTDAGVCTVSCVSVVPVVEFRNAPVLALYPVAVALNPIVPAPAAEYVYVNTWFPLVAIDDAAVGVTTPSSVAEPLPYPSSDARGVTAFAAP